MKNTTYMRRVFGHNKKPARGIDSFRAGRYERDGVEQSWNFVWDGNFSARNGTKIAAFFPMGHLLWGRGNGSFGAGTTVGVLNDELTVIPEGTVVATGGTTYIVYGMFGGELSRIRVHLFTEVGSTNFVVTTGGDIEYLVVAGGGGGGGVGSGGGAGGLIHTFKSPSTISEGTYAAVVGDGGIAAPSYTDYLGRPGGNSSFWGQTAIGGGGGRAMGYRRGNGQSGGSGGGATAYYEAGVTYTGGVATLGQGYAGGSALSSNTTSTSGGGGGAGGAGGDATTGGTLHGDGGVGLDLSSHIGALVGDDGWFAGGGGGRSVDASGGKGGGGEMSVNDGNGQSNTGGGGGGGAYGLGKGGSGIVIVRYRI